MSKSKPRLSSIALPETPLNHSILEAIQTVRHFITETTGKEPTDEEIADTLKRYFVLNEIKEHILLVRSE